MSARDESADDAPDPIAALPMGVEQRAEGGLNGDASPPRKRARVEGGGAGAGGAESLRRRVLEHKLARLRALRERATEQLSELYFLQAGGNMVELAAWRRRAPQGLQAFLEARRPPPLAPPPPDPPPPPPQHEVLAKAKQEALVARRVAELARQGLWAERRLPRVMEPPRPKTHWDYLLEEMAWLAQDFAHERKWKKQAAKKCARAIQKHFQDKALAAQKAEKAQELHLKKLAAFAAKEIRSFWANVEKLVEWKRARRVERARKVALDARLSDIVGRTEQYSRALAANLGAPPSAGVSAPPSPPPSPADDYGPSGEDSADDENTIAEQERTESTDHAAELAALRDEAELGLDELVRRYSAAPPPTPATTSAASTNTNTSDSEESDTDTDSGGDSDTSGSEDAPPLETLVRDEAGEQPDGESGERRVEACSSLAAALQPTGYTLADTAVGTPVPRLVKHPLREYQHVGLHWLATMHARRLNGILADEMGLGKTIQTIALLAHLALERGEWGPHLVVAPTSVVLNWELEFKKWCPAFKLLVYYGNIKERKAKRQGWTKANAFHVCITSYKLVVQDHQSFRRKRWQYLVLDEAQNIKNFKSQRWQTLLNFQTERRLLLTGTPLQNSLLELWSLMHFLMPSVFASHTHFREWFGEVAAGCEAAPSARDEALVRRLHRVLRPFLLRRLKADVERQMPRKFEHVLMCRLARRQRALYDDFMARANTKASLASGNLLSVINVLMQLRKVCNHPDLFEPRPVSSPLALAPLRLALPALVLGWAVARQETAARLGGDLATLEASGAGAFAAHRARHLAPPRRLVERLLERPPPAPRPPEARLRLHLRLVGRSAPPAAPPPPLPPPAPCPAPAPAAAPPPQGALARLQERRLASLRRLAATNERRCWRLPLFGSDLRTAVAVSTPLLLPQRTLESMLLDMHHLIDRFTICWEAARAPALTLAVGGGAAPWRARLAAIAAGVEPPLRSALSLLHAPLSRRAVSFPHPRLLQYDCGKLQTLDALLRRLKAGGHRVLIFTQMTRVLDVLEAFLSLHGHVYLRLDGSTRVEARQPIVERFNGDTRVFAMILSTRSGGVGLNLTGADAVVFYDSDWNPTMDAQAMDRAHRIGQTRDVHVYRLVTQGTVEENILRKADQKRALGTRAIEDGHFTTNYLRKENISELFGCAPPEPIPGAASTDGPELETALAAAEDEADAAAAARARTEQSDELAEFDESQPLQEDPRTELKDEGDPDAALMEQLSPVERYAMRLVESSEAASEAERAALDGMRRALERPERRERRPAQPAPPPPEPEPQITYSAAEARAKVWVCEDKSDGLWAPPTPPRHPGDVYCEQWARTLYRAGAAPDSALPAARARRRLHAARATAPPPSLFERGGARPRQRARAAPAAAHGPPAPDWSPPEDAALRRALRLQRLPPEPSAALAPNWEWAAELVNDTAARAYRSARAARDRSDALADPERARRKHRKPAPRRRQEDEPKPRPPLARLDALREAQERRRAQPKRRLDDAALHNPKHAALLLEHGVHYDSPPTPMDVASRRADRIAKEKLKAAPQPAAAAPPPAAPAPAPPAAPAPPPPRLLLATPAAGPSPSPGRAAPALYRPPGPARHHLKIVGQAGEGGAALRTLQLQQLQLRRGGPAGSGPRLLAPRHSHVVVAHLAPAHHQHHPPPPRPDDGNH